MFPPALEIRPADAGCLGEVLAILDGAAAWLRSRAVVQWPDQFDADDVLTTILQGDTWVVRLQGAAVGTITVNRSDALWEAGEDAGYVHRLAVLRSAPGLGLRLLDWAAEVVRLRGGRFLRLDCVATNPRLRAYYEAAGFRHRGDVPVASSKPLGAGAGGTCVHSLYERRLDLSRPRRTGA